MPCQACNSYPSESDLRKQELDKVTRLLCWVMTTLVKKKPAIAEALIDSSAPESSELMAWWHKHQREDRARELAQENKQREKQEAIDAYLKLSPKQRKLLGVRDPR
jgi:hypothetical protein